LGWSLLVIELSPRVRNTGLRRTESRLQPSQLSVTTLTGRRTSRKPFRPDRDSGRRCPRTSRGGPARRRRCPGTLFRIARIGSPAVDARELPAAAFGEETRGPSHICGGELPSGRMTASEVYNVAVDRGEAISLESLLARANELIEAIARSDVDDGDLRQQLRAELREVNAAIGAAVSLPRR
jgi:hypothetical protein